MRDESASGLEYLGNKKHVEVAERQTQLRIARLAAGKTGSSAAVRYAFIARPDPSDGPPALARILRGGGGRGGAVRLKLYLSLLWLSRGRDSPVHAYPAGQLAALIGLPGTATAGARRVQESLKWLESAGFVALDRRRGDATRVHVLDDAGSGLPYKDAGALSARKPKSSKVSEKERSKHYYVQLKSGFWSNGWVRELSGAAVAMYLTMLHEQGNRVGESVWVSPRIARERYDLSDETRGKGLRELVDAELLTRSSRPVPNLSFFDERYRGRSEYTILPEALDRTRPASSRFDGTNHRDPFAELEDSTGW
ncbi:hypothetical protein [Streptomyces incanus]